MSFLLNVLIDKKLKEHNESIKDILYISIPLDLIHRLGTLEEIHCHYLYVDPEKQDIPLIIITVNYMYYYTEELQLVDIKDDGSINYFSELQSFKISMNNQLKDINEKTETKEE